MKKQVCGRAALVGLMVLPLAGAPADAPPTFAKDVAPILYKNYRMPPPDDVRADVLDDI